MFYERKIKYLDYLVMKEKCGSAGFFKSEVRDRTCNIAINVCNLRTSDSLSAKVYLIGNGQEYELCHLDIVQGKGSRLLSGQDIHSIGRTGLSYEELEAVRIPISPDREIYGFLGKQQGKSVGQVETAEELWEQESVPECVLVDEKTPVETMLETVSVGSVQVEPTEEPYVAPLSVAEMNELKMVAVRKKAPEPKNEKSGNDTEPRVPLFDNKWEQLWEIYPHIMPFHDEREYLSIGPNDFVILPGKYFRMANNSFLLHGYYNYKHLILKRLEHHGEVRYYIGVPGNFYDREKQVAIMFGFESFESLEEPASAGDYGYYMMRVEL